MIVVRTTNMDMLTKIESGAYGAWDTLLSLEDLEKPMDKLRRLKAERQRRRRRRKRVNK